MEMTNYLKGERNCFAPFTARSRRHGFLKLFKFSVFHYDLDRVGL